MPVYNSVLKVKALVGALNQEKALVGAFSVLRDCEKSSRIVIWSSRLGMVWTKSSEVCSLQSYQVKYPNILQVGVLNIKIHILAIIHSFTIIKCVLNDV